MKQIATIGLVLVPLLAGCAGDTLGPGKAPQTAHLDAQSIPHIQKELKSLKWRVRSLKRRVAKQSPSNSQTDRRELLDIKKRLSELETLEANARRNSNAAVNQGGLAPRVAARLASLESKLGRLEVSQTRRSSSAGPATSGSAGVSRKDHAALSKRFAKMEQGLEKDRSLVIDFLEDLDNRLSALEEPKPSGNAPAAKQPPKP